MFELCLDLIDLFFILSPRFLIVLFKVIFLFGVVLVGDFKFIVNLINNFKLYIYIITYTIIKNKSPNGFGRLIGAFRQTPPI
jgi:hypothetical protein